MAIDHAEAQLIRNLINLIESGKITAEDHTNPAWNNHYTFSHKGLQFDTEWSQDDQPQLFINNVLAIRGYELNQLMHELSERFTKPIRLSDAAKKQTTEELKMRRATVEYTLKRLKEKG
jgi:hypothetical protein